MQSDTPATRAAPSPVELATMRGGAAERFVPGLMRGQLIEADHLTRYMWAAQFAANRRVLDAGCGVAYGSRLLAEAGARSVLGVDVAESVVEAVAPEMPAGVTLEVGDVRALSHPDGAFDLVVCFEVIEHVAEPTEIIDELIRVLAPDGLLVLSSPDRDTTVGENPHHLHELTRDELSRVLAVRLSHFRILRQDAYLSSAIVPQSGLSDEVANVVAVPKAGPSEEGTSSYVLAVGSREPVADPAPLLGVTSRLDFHHWQTVFDGAERRARAQEQRIAELEQLVLDRAELQERLLYAEQRLAMIPELELRGAELREELRRLREEEIQVFQERIARADQVLRDVQSSPSWKITRPLRELKSILRG